MCPGPKRACEGVTHLATIVDLLLQQQDGNKDSEAERLYARLEKRRFKKCAPKSFPSFACTRGSAPVGAHYRRGLFDLFFHRCLKPTLSEEPGLFKTCRHYADKQSRRANPPVPALLQRGPFAEFACFLLRRHQKSGQKPTFVPLRPQRTKKTTTKKQKTKLLE